MSRRNVSGIILCVLLLGVLTFAVQLAKSSPATITVPDYYLTIQEAIGEADEGDTIFVRNGTYYESIVVNKSLSLVGENRVTTIIDGNGSGPLVTVTSNNVNITGLTLQNTTSISRHWNPEFGILLQNVTGCNIVNNIIKNHLAGILGFAFSKNAIIKNIIIKNDLSGIGLANSTNNNIVDNNVSANGLYGIGLLDSSNNNIIVGNNVIDNIGPGIGVWTFSSNNSIFENKIINNGEGITLWNSTNNMIYRNNFINNENHTRIESSFNNSWDNGIEGNYWSNYNGTDLDEDGIGDTPYFIDEDNQDNYPLMKPSNPLFCDMNYDFKIDMRDIGIAAWSIGAYPTHPRWKIEADVNQDGKVDIKDLISIARHFGETYP